MSYLVQSVVWALMGFAGAAVLTLEVRQLWDL